MGVISVCLRYLPFRSPAKARCHPLLFHPKTGVRSVRIIRIGIHVRIGHVQVRGVIRCKVRRLTCVMVLIMDKVVVGARVIGMSWVRLKGRVLLWFSILHLCDIFDFQIAHTASKKKLTISLLARISSNSFAFAFAWADRTWASAARRSVSPCFLAIRTCARARPFR